MSLTGTRTRRKTAMMVKRGLLLEKRRRAGERFLGFGRQLGILGRTRALRMVRLLFYLGYILTKIVALQIEWCKVYARSQRWDMEVMLLKEEFRHLKITLEFEAEKWLEHSRSVEARSELEEVYVQGMRVYAAQQEVVFRNLADQARATEIASKLATGKAKAHTRAVDPPQNTKVPGLESDGDDDVVILVAVRDEDMDEERGGVESDKEVIMGGELDDI
jgi:hypothetical protein